MKSECEKAETQLGLTQQSGGTLLEYVSSLREEKTEDKDKESIVQLIPSRFTFTEQETDAGKSTERVCKGSSNPPLLRHQALVTFKNSMMTTKRAVTDATMKDIFKQMRQHLSDKVLPVQRASAKVFIAIYTSDDSTHPTISNVETILNICIKSLDSVDQLTCHILLAQFVGRLLASTPVERATPAPNSAQKSREDNADDDTMHSPHVAVKVKKALLSPAEMLALLSHQFNKSHQSRKIRVGIFDFCAALFMRLGAGWVEANFLLVLDI